MPCNFHLRVLGAKVKEGIRAAGGTPMELNTIAISDGITMGTAGMRASLPSREVIADSIELVCDAHMFDAVIAIWGCDKTIPATVMALCRLNVPSLMLYGGSIMPGHFHGEQVTIQEVFEAVGRYAAGTDHRGRAPRARGGGLPAPAPAAASSPPTRWRWRSRCSASRRPGFSMVPATHPRKAEVAADAGRLVMDVLARGQLPARSSPATASRTRSRRSRAAGGRPTACFTCWRSPPRWASSCRSTTSTGSASGRRCYATSSPAASTSPRISTRQAACRSCSSG